MTRNEFLILDVDRKAAWPYAKFHCLPDRQMRERWFQGYYDNLSEGQAILDFAIHRETALKVAVRHYKGMPGL